MLESKFTLIHMVLWWLNINGKSWNNVKGINMHRLIGSQYTEQCNWTLTLPCRSCLLNTLVFKKKSKTAFNNVSLLERRTKMSNKSGRIDSTVVEDEYLRAIKYQRLKVLNQALLTRVVFEQQIHSGIMCLFAFFKPSMLD